MADTMDSIDSLGLVAPMTRDDIAAPLLAASGISVSYGPTVALRDVNLDIPRGEVCAIAGPSGSGKSTLLHCLAGLLQPDIGSVVFDGVDLARAGEGERAALRLSRFGFVFQFGHLIHELTALDNVALPLRLRGTPRRAARDAARAVLDSLGLAAHADTHPADLSGGQYQRVAVARALASAPDVIFADEPTGALDSSAAGLVLTEVTDLARDRGATVVLVSHDPDVVAVADRVIRLRDGRLET